MTSDLHDVLIAWHEQHHPQVDIDLERWTNALTRQATPDNLAAALEQWTWKNTTPPNPGRINELIRQPLARRTALQSIQEARRELDDARERARTRAEELAYVRTLARRLYPDNDELDRWLRAGNPLLDGQSPTQLIWAGGADRVVDLITDLTQGAA